MKELTAKEIIEISNPKKVESLEICGATFSLNQDLEIVWYNDEPAIFMGEEDNWYYILMLKLANTNTNFVTKILKETIIMLKLEKYLN